MRVFDLKFGPVDTRHAFSIGTETDAVFRSAFVNPSNIDLNEFVSGERCFIYGIKGSGKSALLKYLQIMLRDRSVSQFVYFTDNLKDIKKISNKKKEDEIAVAREADAFDDPDEYWSSFFFFLIAKTIYEHDYRTGKQYLEFIRRNSTGAPSNFFSKIFSRAPTLESWASQIQQAPKIELKGNFSDIVNLTHFYQSALSILEDVKLNKPYYIMIDELEVLFQSDTQFKQDVEIARSLIVTVRNLNEKFRTKGIPIFLVCAIRREVANKIIGGDAAKIVRDLGRIISWEKAARNDTDDQALHPLFEIAINRIIVSEQGHQVKIDDQKRRAAINKYFPFYKGASTQRFILDLTTYRPRDISIVFGEAQKHHRQQEYFEFETFYRRARKDIRNALWTDFSEALRTRYSENTVSVFGRALMAVPDRFTIRDFEDRLDDFSGDPAIAEILEKIDTTAWFRIFKELYELGAVGQVDPRNDEEDHLKFHFRGDTDELIIGQKIQLVKPNGLRAP